MAAADAQPSSTEHSVAVAGLRVPGLLLGVAFGGFFDGILLHQVLQWHHLLSGLAAGRLGDLRFQLLADGAFHALMYLLAAVALLLLYTRRHYLVAPGNADALLAYLVTGFALWHALDALLSHWLLGIHRIRVDSTQPMAWDVGWLIVFGVLPWLWARRHARMARARSRSAGAGSALWVLVCITALAGALSARTPDDAPTVVLLVDPARAAALLAALPADTRIVGADPTGTVWFFDGTPPPTQSGSWKLRGAWLPAGCLAWTRA